MDLTVSPRVCLWPEFPHWYHRKMRGQDAGRSGKLNEAKTRETTARAELAELELAAKRGELSEKGTVVKAFATVVRQMDAKLRGMIPQAAGRLWGAKSPVELTERVRLLVEEARNDLRTLGKL